jgi:hypothetical protein
LNNLLASETFSRFHLLPSIPTHGIYQKRLEWKQKFNLLSEFLLLLSLLYHSSFHTHPKLPQRTFVCSITEKRLTNYFEKSAEIFFARAIEFSHFPIFIFSLIYFNSQLYTHTHTHTHTHTQITPNHIVRHEWKVFNRNYRQL